MAYEHDDAGKEVLGVKLHDENIDLNRALTVALIGSPFNDVTINAGGANPAAATGWIDVSDINPETLSLIIDASTSTGTVTLTIDMAEDAFGYTSVGSAVVTVAGIAANTIIDLSAETGFVYAHFMKFTFTETATADFIFHSALMGRAI